MKSVVLIFNLVTPIVLLILFLFDGLAASDKILSASFFFAFPESVFDFKSDIENVNTTVEIQQNSNFLTSEKHSSTITSSNMLSDVHQIMSNAEQTYANSSNDGKIIEVDYSRQNATSEFNGVYLRNTTLSHKVNISDYINKKIYAEIDATQPVVLIYHTHSSETYELLDRGYYTNERSSLSDNPKENMIRIGEEISKVLEKNGYKTIHDKTVFDKEYNGAYERSRTNIQRILNENPSIQIVLDIHRGSMYQKDGSRIKPVTKIGDKKIAQIQIVTGCEDGNVTDFPYWEKNLTFALNLQKKLADNNPTLVRPLNLCSRKYNMDLLPCALQIEVGTDANTLLEAVYAAEFFAKSLTALLKECEI